MKLDKKKSLAVRVLNVGKERIVFVKGRENEIKEAITKQDIRDLKNEGAILIKEKKGRKKKDKNKKSRGLGKVKIIVNKRKRTYVIITRKLRAYLKDLKMKGKISSEDFKDIRKKIRNRQFSSLKSMKDFLGGKK